MADGCKLPRLLLETAGSNCGCQRRIQQLEGRNDQDSLWLLFFVLCLVSGTLLPGLCCWDFAAGGDSFFFLFLSSRLFVRALPREKKKKGTTPEIKKKKKKKLGHSHRPGVAAKTIGSCYEGWHAARVSPLHLGSALTSICGHVLFIECLSRPFASSTALSSWPVFTFEMLPFTPLTADLQTSREKKKPPPLPPRPNSVAAAPKKKPLPLQHKGAPPYTPARLVPYRETI